MNLGGATVKQALSERSMLSSAGRASLNYSSCSVFFPGKLYNNNIRIFSLVKMPKCKTN